MPRFMVHLVTEASTSIEVEVDELETDKDTAEAAIEAAYEHVPYVCAHCSGWGQRAGIEVGDWEPANFEPVTAL